MKFRNAQLKRKPRLFSLGLLLRALPGGSLMGLNRPARKLTRRERLGWRAILIPGRQQHQYSHETSFLQVVGGERRS